jgi:hypothetical protein
MRISKKRCLHCRRWFRPYARRRPIQRFCALRPCQRERHRRNCLAFYRNDPHCDGKRRQKIRDWARRYPDYWRRYRAAHPGYRERERRRMQAKRGQAIRVAKRDVWRRIAVERLRDIQAQGTEFVAKRDVFDRRVEAVLEFLVWKETSQNETVAQAGVI